MPELKADYCVVGAGFAGLVAAYRLRQAGQSVVVLEARDRVGGRTWTKTLSDGTRVELGGTFLGPGQESAYSLVAELGVKTFSTHHEGDVLLLIDDEVHRYKKIPNLDLLSLGSVWLAMKALGAMAKEVPSDAPWSAPKAREWDAMTIQQWIDHHANLPTEAARRMLKMSMHGIFTSDPSEVSLLHALFQIATSNSFEALLQIEGGSEQDQVEGGMASLYDKLAEKLKDVLHLNSPVRKISQNETGVVIKSDTHTVSAKRVIITIPPNLADHIQYEPGLPPTRAQLMQRMPAGQAIRYVAVFEEAFWRHDGLMGESAAPGHYVELTLDGSDASGKPGILHFYSFGEVARQMATIDPELRKTMVLEAIAERFGPKAALPLHFVEQDWCGDPWSRGGSMAHYAPGVITNYGSVIREACGRIHWAGTETALRWCGNVDGAISSGDRAAKEVVAAEKHLAVAAG